MSQANLHESVNFDMLRFLTELAELRFQEATVPINVACIGHEIVACLQASQGSHLRFGHPVRGLALSNATLVPSSLI